MALPGNKNFSDYDNFITDQEPTTSAQAQDYFRNQAELLKAVIDCDFWQPETTYQPGDVVKSDSMPNGVEAVMVATKASTTSNVEPQWGAVGGANISDGACFWKLRRKAVTVNGIEADNKGNVQIPVMQGSTSTDNGVEGLVPAPSAGGSNRYLNADGTFKEVNVPVTSVNGNTGDVVVGEVTDIDINGTTITATFADQSTKDIKIPDGVVPKRYVVETFKSGYDWYEVYNDGWVRQGGWVAGVTASVTKTITFLKPFADKKYTVYGAYCSDSDATSFTIRVMANVATNGIDSATSMKILVSANRGSKFWVAEGQGA